MHQRVTTLKTDRTVWTPQELLEVWHQHQGVAVTQNAASRQRHSSVLNCGQECFPPVDEGEAPS
jgi:hypothetical protein